MKFKYPIWSLILAFLLFFPIAYSGINWLAIFPAVYILSAFVTLCIIYSKKTF